MYFIWYTVQPAERVVIGFHVYKMSMKKKIKKKCFLTLFKKLCKTMSRGNMFWTKASVG